MTREEQLTILKSRYEKLSANGKNIKCPGVRRKLARQIRNLSK